MELLKLLLQFLKGNMFSVNEKQTSFKNQPYLLSTNVIRKFDNANAVMFVNFGTSAVMINDIFPLLPSIAVIRPVGATITFKGDKNEIDNTYYKITFDNTGVNSLGVYVKENAGYNNTEILIDDFDKNAIPSDKREQDITKKRTKGNF